MARSLTHQKKAKTKPEHGSPDWYLTAEGRREGIREFQKALREGTLEVHPRGLGIPKTNPKVLQELMERAKERALRPVSLRLPVADIERAKVIASQKGIGYQTVLKEAIRTGLAKSA